MNSTKSLIVVGGLAAGLVGGAWAWTNSQAGNTDTKIAANGIEQSTVSAEGLAASNTKLSQELSLPAMYAAVPLSSAADTEKSTRAPEPPTSNAVEVVEGASEEIAIPSIQPTVSEPESDSLVETSLALDSTAVAPMSPSGEATVTAALGDEDVVLSDEPVVAPQKESRPVDYGHLNERLLQVADALERLNLRLAALAAPREEAPSADATRASELNAETDNPAEG